ncbi:hypothetical protein ACFRDV_23905 [Streptomyces fagopyri]|uniref:hypothetical protein n=1 Tax=Streptomyces fagopyri TaxID=2662397 RepID=UPI0036B92D0C
MALTSSSSRLGARAKCRTVEWSSRSRRLIAARDLTSDSSCCTAVYRSVLRATSRLGRPRTSRVPSGRTNDASSTGGSAVPLRAVAHSVTAVGVVNALRTHG